MLISDTCVHMLFPSKSRTIYSFYTNFFMLPICACVQIKAYPIIRSDLDVINFYRLPKANTRWLEGLDPSTYGFGLVIFQEKPNSVSYKYAAGL